MFGATRDDALSIGAGEITGVKIVGSGSVSVYFNCHRVPRRYTASP